MKEEAIANQDIIGLQTLEVISKADHFNKWMYETIRPFLKGNILEIGSGIGNISSFAIDEGLTITLSDFDPEYCRLLKNKYANEPNVKEIISIDLQQPSFRNTYQLYKEKYDTIFLLNVLEHLENDLAAVSNCRYLLKEGGTLIILVPAYRFLFCRLDKELGHYRRYTIKTLKLLFKKQGFSILHKQYFNFFGLFGWFLFGKCFGRKTIGSSEMSAYNKLVPVFRLTDSLILRKAGLSAIIAGQKKRNDF
jgi:SAM-dependent methyltransferase